MSRTRESAKGSWRRWLTPAVVALLTLPAPVAPAVIVVSGDCELAEAIENANDDAATNIDCAAGSGADEIQLTENVTLTAMDNGLDGSNGLPSVQSEITIAGAGYSIVRDDMAPAFRILHIDAGGDLTLDDVTVSGGRIESGLEGGGGVFNRGDLTLTSSTISGNTVDAPVYAYGGGIYSVGSVTLTDSTVSGNAAIGDYAYGGGIFSDIGSPLSMETSAVSGNSVSGEYAGGGGVEALYRPIITTSTIADNTGYATGAYNSTVTAPGISVSGGLILTYSTVSGNSATAAGPAPLLIGGGITSRGILSMTNSTISSNTISTTAPGGVAYGAGINQGLNGTGTLNLVTFSSNSVSAPSYFGGAAIFQGSSTANLNVVNTIFGASTGGHCDGFGTLNDILNNLADDSTCGSVSPTLTGLDLNLMDNGGPTRTHALELGSTAIDASGFCGLPSDQRGVERPEGFCDAGAYEFNGCLAADGDSFLLEMEDITGDRTIEVCGVVTVGPEVVVMGPSGHLTLRAGQKASFVDGFEVEPDGRLTVEIDPNLNM